MLSTLEMISAKLREINRMQKRKQKIKIFRAQVNHDIFVKKNDKKKSNKTKKSDNSKSNKLKNFYFFYNKVDKFN